MKDNTEVGRFFNRFLEKHFPESVWAEIHNEICELFVFIEFAKSEAGLTDYKNTKEERKKMLSAIAMPSAELMAELAGARGRENPLALEHVLSELERYLKQEPLEIPKRIRALVPINRCYQFFIKHKLPVEKAANSEFVRFVDHVWQETALTGGAIKAVENYLDQVIAEGKAPKTTH